MIGAKTKIAAAAALMAAIVAPGVASAQSGYYQGPAYGHGQSYDYRRGPVQDPCYRDGRTGAGGVIGATAGAVLGSQVAARGRRTEGSILGGVLGAVIGSQVGRASSEGCYNQQVYDDRRGYGYQAPSYDDRYGRYDYGYGYGQPQYDPRYDNRRDYDDGYRGGYDYDRGGDCRLAESRIRLPDGRYETRHVRSCRDSSGRYRVVD